MVSSSELPSRAMADPRYRVPLFCAGAGAAGVPLAAAAPTSQAPGLSDTKFKFTRATKDNASMQWDPDSFVKPNLSSAGKAGRRRIQVAAAPTAVVNPAIPAPPPAPPAMPRALPRSNSFKKAKAPSKEADDFDSDDSEAGWPSLPTKRAVPMTDPMHKKDIEVHYSAIGWTR